MYDAKVAIYCISLFNLYVTVSRELFIVSTKHWGALRCFFGLDDIVSSALNMSLKYSGTVPFLYL